MIERREIHLSGVCLLRDYLTAANHVELLTEAAHKTKLQVLELLARRFPRPDVKSRIRKLPTYHAQPAQQVSISVESAQSVASSARTSTSPLPQAPSHELARERPDLPPIVRTASGLGSGPRAPFAAIEPTSESRYRIQLNATASLKEKLELLRALMSHSVPGGDLAAVVERAVEMALDQVQKQRFAKTAEPRSARTRVSQRSSYVRRLERKTPSPRVDCPGQTAHREHIPNATQREVATRDGLRCTYVSDAGCRCTAQSFLQIHHDKPWARGGASTPENLRLLCAAHNGLLAERDFGAVHIVQCREARRSQAP